LIILVLIPQEAFSSHQIQFNGSFGEISFSGNEACRVVFSEIDYTTKHFLVGPTRRILVSQFTGEENAFFHTQSFMGNYGYNSDFLDQKEITKHGFDFSLEVYGIVTNQFALIDVTASIEDQRQDFFCQAYGRYFASN